MLTLRLAIAFPAILFGTFAICARLDQCLVDRRTRCELSADGDWLRAEVSKNLLISWPIPRLSAARDPAGLTFYLLIIGALHRLFGARPPL